MLERIPYYIMATAHHSLSAEEKYFLIRALHLYGFSVINRPVAELEVVMGLSDSVLKRAREQLVKKALLVEVPGIAKEEEGRHAGGRPPKAFRVSEACFEWLRQGRSDKQRGRQEELVQQLMVSCHLDKLGHLLFWGRRFGEGNDLLEVATVTGKLIRRQAPPRYVTRMLLAILAGLADGAGVVRQLGRGELAQLSGIQRQALEYQLGKLAEEGYLRAQVPGVTGRFAFGQTVGALFLDMGNAVWPQPSSELLVCVEDKFLLEHYPFRVGHRVYFQAAGYLRRKVPPVVGSLDATLARVKGWLLEKEGVEPVPRRLPGYEAGPNCLMKGSSITALYALWEDGELYRVFQDRQGEFLRQLQSKVEEYGSELLSEYWDKIDQGDLLPEEMLARIRRELLPKQMTDRKGGEDNRSTVMPEALALYIYIVALRMAYWIKALLVHDLPAKAWQGLAPAQAHITVLPAPDCRDLMAPIRFAISIVPKKPVSSLSSQVIGITRTVDRMAGGLAAPQVEYGKEVAGPAYWLQAPGIKAGLKRIKEELTDTPPQNTQVEAS